MSYHISVIALFQHINFVISSTGSSRWKLFVIFFLLLALVILVQYCCFLCYKMRMGPAPPAVRGESVGASAQRAPVRVLARPAPFTSPLQPARQCHPGGVAGVQAGEGALQKQEHVECPERSLEGRAGEERGQHPRDSRAQWAPGVPPGRLALGLPPARNGPQKRPL